ncbi:MAG: hypothetical protein IJM31_02620 [Campylobacter sp.]|nr:hypothetical protein [Campylobacter sp.]
MASGVVDSRVFRVMFVSEEMRKIFSDEKNFWRVRIINFFQLPVNFLILNFFHDAKSAIYFIEHQRNIFF